MDFSKLFSLLFGLHNEALYICFSRTTGVTPRPSINPDVRSKFSKSATGGKHRRGGGLVLICRYYLQLSKEEHRQSVSNEISTFLIDNDGSDQIEI